MIRGDEVRVECKDDKHQWSGDEAKAGARLRVTAWTVAMETDALPYEALCIVTLAETSGETKKQK